MLRTKITRSAHILYSRPFSTIPKHNGILHVRHVRVVRPFFTRKRLNRTIVWVAVGLFLWGQLESLIEDEEEENKPGQVKEAVRQVKKVTEGEKLNAEAEVADDDDEEVGPDDAWFIPCGWPQKRPREYYKGTDPEWISFTDFARSQKQGILVRNQLAASVGAYFANDKRIQKVLGTPITVDKFWLDVDYPYGPPQEYEQAGIEITDEYVAWVIRPIDQMNVARLRHAILPMPLVYSLWESYKTLWNSNMDRIRKTFNVDPPQRRFPPGFALPKKTGEIEKPQTPKITPSSTQSQNQWSKLLPSIPTPGEDYAGASRAFKKTLAKNWNKGGSVEPPRGTLLVSGLVKLNGPDGHCLLDVRAAYEPSSSQWVAISVALRRIQPRVYYPKG